MGDVALRSIGAPKPVVDRAPVGVAVAAVAAVATVIVVVAVATAAGRGPGDAVVAAHALAAALIAIRIAVHRPARRVSWALVAIGCAVHAVGAVLLLESVGGGLVDAATAQALSALAYPALFAGVAGVTARDSTGWSSDPWSATVATIVGTGVVLLALTLPRALHGDAPVRDAEWGGVLATGDLLIAAVAALGMLGRRGRDWPAWLLTAGFVAWGNGHAEIGARLADGADPTGSPVVWTVVAGSVLVGLAALVPTRRIVPEGRPDGDRRRAAVAGAQLLVAPPAVLVVVHAADADAGRAWVVVAAVLAVTVAVRRVARLAADLDGP